MARDEQHREDLLAEATALVERVSLELAAGAAPVVMGFRRDHGASIYFDDDRVYQFTSGGQLRRAFVDELLYKAQRGRLVAMRRERGAQAVELVSHEVDEDGQREFIAEMSRRLDGLHHALAKNHFKIVAQVPDDADIVSRIRCWLDEFAGRAEIAHSPHAS